MAKRKLVVQGDFDGACFLYSIVNSVISLSKRKPTLKQWSNALQYIPFSHDFIYGDVGTKNYDDNYEIYKFAIKQALSELSPSKNYEVITHPKINSFDDTSNLINQNSILILNLNGDHWICVVDTNERETKLLSACSDITSSTEINGYSEKNCRFNRLYNKEYIIGTDYKIYKTSVIQIKMVS